MGYPNNLFQYLLIMSVSAVRGSSRVESFSRRLFGRLDILTSGRRTFDKSRGRRGISCSLAGPNRLGTWSRKGGHNFEYDPKEHG